jgi:hypothetical protein
MANTTWSTTDKAASVTLSGSSLTATATASATALRAVDRQISGKFYWEYTVGTWAGTNSSVGFASFMPPTTAVSATPVGACVVLKSSGGIYVNNVNTGIALGAVVTGNVLCFAVDFTAQLGWVRLGAAGNWNGNVANNPATGAGGFSIASIIGSIFPLYPYAAFAGSTDSVTANFGDTTLAGAVPAGFTGGFTAGASFSTNVLGTQTFVEHWATFTPAAQLTQAFVEHWAVPNPQFQVTQFVLDEWVSGQSAMQLTNISIEQWAQISSINTQMVLTQISVDEWASVAVASTPVSGTLTAEGFGVFNAVGVAVSGAPAGGPMVILMM